MTSTSSEWKLIKQGPYDSIWEKRIEDHIVLRAYDTGSAYDGCYDCYAASVSIKGFEIGGMPKSYSHLVAQKHAEMLWERFKNNFERKDSAI